MSRPKVNSESQKQLDQADDQFKAFSEQISSFSSVDQKAASEETEPQTKLSKREAKKMDAPYIEPERSVACSHKEKFNEKYRKDWERGWERVKCIVENNEIIGEKVPVWTKKFAGDPYHFWQVPVNKPIYIPRLLAEQLAACKYRRLIMQDAPTSNVDGMQFYGSMSVESVKNRIDARPIGFTL